MVKNLPSMWETWVWPLGWEDPLEKGMATHSSIFAWRIPWTEGPGGLQSTESQRVRHDWTTNTWNLSIKFKKNKKYHPSSPSFILLKLNYIKREFAILISLPVSLFFPFLSLFSLPVLVNTESSRRRKGTVLGRIGEGAGAQVWPGNKMECLTLQAIWKRLRERPLCWLKSGGARCARWFLQASASLPQLSCALRSSDYTKRKPENRNLSSCCYGLWYTNKSGSSHLNINSKMFHTGLIYNLLKLVSGWVI